MAAEVSTPRRKLSAILMVDVSGFSRMMGRDEEGTTALIREFHSRVRSVVEAHEGRVVDTAGDSVFGEFDSVIKAVQCAQAIQGTQAMVNAGRPPEERIETRIGVHLGDVIVQDYQVYGDGVNIAARLEALADPGGICVSEAVYQQVFQKLDLAFEDLGVQKLKNIDYPIRLYRVLPDGYEGRKEPAREPVKDLLAPGPHQPLQRSGSWVDALLARGGIIPVALGLCLIASLFGLFPFRHPAIASTAGAVLVGLGAGHIWAHRTGRRGHFFIALGAGFALDAAFTAWIGLPGWPFVLVGAIIVLQGLRRLSRENASGAGLHRRLDERNRPR